MSIAAPTALSGLGIALPPNRSQAELWDGFFAGHYADQRRVFKRIWHGCGVERRHGVADPVAGEDVSDWSTGRRMRRFQEAALPLGEEAIAACLADVGLAAEEVGQLTVVSCTGYATPGLDILLAERLGMSPTVQRLHIGHMGCYAAIPGLATASDAATARGKAAIVLCLELTSLHVQPPSGDLEQLVAHALFSDAAVAAAVLPDGRGLQVEDVVARTDPEHAALMTWDVTDLGFRMGLSPKVPDVLAKHVRPAVDDLLAANGLERGDVAAWAVHPGGPRILDVVGEQLALSDGDLAQSEAVLREHGNCSSATVLLVLDRIRAERDLQRGDPVVAMAFGPGLTLYAALLRA